MKTVYYCITYTDGIKQFQEKQVEDDFNVSLLTERLFESGNIRTITPFNSREEYMAAKTIGDVNV